jgi:hypothetical protein
MRPLVTAVATSSRLVAFWFWSCCVGTRVNHPEDGQMASTATCEECGEPFDVEELEDGYCESCGESLAAAGRAAMDPDGHGYGEDGIWDPERLGL